VRFSYSSSRVKAFLCGAWSKSISVMMVARQAVVEQRVILCLFELFCLLFFLFPLPLPNGREEGRQSFSCVGIKATLAALPQELENHKTGLQNYIWFRNNEVL